MRRGASSPFNTGLSGGGIKWDAQAYFANLRKLAREQPAAAERVAAQVAIQVLNDAVMEPPTVPIDTGNLRSTGTFEVMRPGPETVRIYVGYNTPYAAKVHEVPMNFQEPSAGNKYLEAKLQRHRVEYMRVWAQKLWRVLRGGA